MLAGWPGWDFCSYLLTFWFRVLYCKLHFEQVIGKLLSLGDGMHIFTEVIKLIIRLCLTIPVSSAIAERWFWTLRRLKTFTRWTMKASRLTHLALLHVHQDHTDKLDLNDLCTTFVSSNERRQGVFRKWTADSYYLLYSVIVRLL